MPPVIAAVAAAIGGGAIATWVATLAVNFAVSYAIGLVFGKKNENGFIAEATDRTQMVRSSVQPRCIIYGTAMASGPLVFAGSSDKGTSKNQYLHLVIALANHECEQIVEVFLGDEALGPLDAGGVPIAGRYAGKVRIKKHLGHVDQEADADLMAEMPAQWTANHRLRGVTYLYVRFEYDSQVFASGLPNVKALLRGKKIYDPRTGMTAWSDNWALCINDYLRAADGLGCEADDVDSLSVIAAANISDETVSLVDGSQQRYRCNGTVMSDHAPDDNLRQLATAGGGPVPVLAGGVFRVFAGAYDAPVATLTDSDLRGPIKIRPRRSRRDLFNTVKGTYVDGAKTWQPGDFPIVRNAKYAAQDGEEIVKDVQLPFTIDSAMGQRLAKISLERARQGITIEYPAKITAFRLSAWDTVRLDSAKFGWSGKIFRILNWKFDASGGVDLVLGEESPQAYSWNSGEQTTVDPAPDTNLPPAGYVPPLGPLTVETGDAHLLTLQDGTTIARLFVSWETSTAGLWRQGGTIEVQYKAETALIWESAASVPGESTSTYIAPVVAGVLYNARARLRSSIGIFSDWTYSSLGAIGKTTPPPPVSFLVTDSLIFGIHLQWNFPPDSYAGRTELWASTTPDRANAVKLSDFAYPQNTHTMSGLGAGAEFWFWARLVDTSGNIGPFYPAGAGVHGESSSDAAAILEYLAGQIGRTQLAQDLLEPIDAIPDILERLDDIPSGAELEEIRAAQQNAAADTDALATTQIFALAGADRALATARTAIEAQAAQSEAAILEELTVVADLAGASATAVTVLQAAIEDPETGLPSLSAAIEETATAVAETNGNLAAMYQVKTQVTSGGIRYFAGFALGVELDAGIVQSQFLVTADKFAIINESSGVLTAPFVVTGGVTYMNSAVIKDASITFAKIDRATFTSLSAITATIGLLRTAASGQRTELDDNGTRVYDAAGTLRVRVGVW